MADGNLLRCLSLVCATTVPSSVAAQPSPDLAAIDRHVEAEMIAARVPGVALGIVYRDRIVHLRGFGVTASNGRPVTPETAFGLGSVSKSFAAMAVMQQVVAGRLDLDAPIKRYIPWFRTADADASAHITTRHLLCHTSGLATHDGLRDFGDLEPDEAVRSLSRLSLHASPGAAFEYSNANYVVLGLIVEVVSGEPYGAYLERQILAPLGMRRTFLASQRPLPEQDVAAGHHYWFGVPRRMSLPPHERATIAAGGIMSCAADMAKYLLAHMNEGRCEGGALLPPQGMAELHAPQLGTTYAMGWFVTDWDGPRRIGHGGGTPGYSATVGFEPASGWGVVALTNGLSYFGNTRRYEIGPGVLALLCGRRPKPIPADLRGAGVYAALVALLGLEGAAVALSLARRRRGAGRAGARTVVPLLLAAAWACVLLAGPWLLFGGPLRLTFLIQPDVVFLLVLVACVAVLLGVVRCIRTSR